IQVTDDEIREALYMAHDQYWVGAGKDAVLWKHRQVEDTAPPFCIMSPDITCDEKYHQSICMAYLKEPLLDGICGPILEETAASSTSIIRNWQPGCWGVPGHLWLPWVLPSMTAARSPFPTTSGVCRSRTHAWWGR
ncbi:MAG: monomethylamine:corrinoid methyltransferase, partial [Deltaproteobacteria bacterium]|nr:monomethylamine:corrinoid methyltransferase [Deltaproteobacteria bacterium]